MKNIRLILLYGGLMLLAIPGFAMAGVVTPELEEALTSAAPDQELAIIVTLADQVDLKKIKDKDKSLLRTKIVKALKDKAEKTQKPIKDFLKQKDAKKIKSFWIFNGLAATASSDLIAQLAEMEGIVRIGLDGTLSISEPETANATLPEWNIQAINAPAFWDLGSTGAGTVVANMDTGVDAGHPDLAGSYRGGANSWFDPNSEHASPHDSTGHGTQVMGVMVGGDAGGSASGVATGAQWIAVKIFADSGIAEYSDIHFGFQWLLDPDDNPATDDTPDVVNSSWGYPQLTGQCCTEFQSDIQTLKAAEIGVVFSAGNGGPFGSSSESPANNAGSFAVGAVDSADSVADFSARGPSACTGDIYPEVVAPGVNILTTDLEDGYTPVNGTSFAAPHIAAAMALLLSTDPTLPVADVETALSQSAHDFGALGPDNEYGYGMVDIMAAYNWLAANQPQCTDGDGDGFCAEADANTVQDCNDNNPSIYPDAPENKGDGIDQDCNGYDLTIEITKAEYLVSILQLTVEATSSLGIDAGLELVGYGTMKWNRKNKTWTVTVSNVTAPPAAVTVSGVEGDESAAPSTVQGDSGGSSGGGKGRKK